MYIERATMFISLVREQIIYPVVIVVVIMSSYPSQVY